jgi:hypothetical protein
MKKKFAIVGLFFSASLLIIYFFLPVNITISERKTVGANLEGVMRFLRTPGNVKKIGTQAITSEKDSTIVYTDGRYDYHIRQFGYNALQLSIHKQTDSIANTLYFVPVNADSFVIQSVFTLQSGKSPLKKISNYFGSKKLQQSIRNFLQITTAFLSKTENLYGVEIKKEKVQFQHFISTKKSFNHPPSTKDIYDLIEAVRGFTFVNNSRELYSPILNIEASDSSSIQVQVAIAVDKQLNGNETFQHKWMMKNGNILVAEVKGGEATIKEGFGNMRNFISDYQKTIMAIPFQMLITNRLQEPDSSKWVTRLYYPVM